MSQGQNEITNVLFRIKRGLSGYVSYLAACEMNESFSEYTLYEPTLRILTAMGFNTKSEVPCPGFGRNLNGGDVKKLDFVAKKSDPELHFALEEKWVRAGQTRISGDTEKLRKFVEHNKGAYGYLLMFGKESDLSKKHAPHGFREKGDPLYAEFKKTKFGCRVFQFLSQ